MLQDSPFNIDEIARIRWACRRGMLELDLFLLPYFEQHYGQLEAPTQRLFINLLASDDPDLFVWLMGKSAPPIDFMELVEHIRATTQNSTS